MCWSFFFNKKSFHKIRPTGKKLEILIQKNRTSQIPDILYNPSQGIAFSTKNPVKEYTKAQKEFLYDYYMERGKETEANKVWK